MAEKLEDLIEKSEEEQGKSRLARAGRYLGKTASVSIGIASGITYYIVTGIFDCNVSFGEQARFILSRMRYF